MIRSPSNDELPALAGFVAKLQVQPEHRIAYLGDTATEIAALFESWDRPWTDSARVAERDGRLVGFVTAEIDEPLGRAWIHGPFVDDPDWDGIADDLFGQLLSAAPVDDFEVVGDVANVRLAEITRRRGFESGFIQYSLELDSHGIGELPPLDAPPLGPEIERSFVELHDTVFPGTYYPGQALVERAARGDSVVVTLTDGESLVAYAAGQIDETGAGYIDFVGVSPDHRREGHGRTAIVALTRALAARQPIPAARLTVSSVNDAALALYDSLGFTRSSSFIGYRRRAGSCA